MFSAGGLGLSFNIFFSRSLERREHVRKGVYFVFPGLFFLAFLT